MLASIRGTVIQKSDFTVVIDCNGFGVEVLATRRAVDLCNVDRQA
ncbi:MAG: Holliday junction branch migration protein RuvA, partial [Pyramidobacter sp.]|nr:Holliday junction branch migration protein RuvA [Pyramidobacter sp.]